MLTRVMESRFRDKNRTERHSPSSSWRSQDEDPVTPPRVLRLSLFSKNFNFPPVMLRMQPGALCILRKHSTPETRPQPLTGVTGSATEPHPCLSFVLINQVLTTRTSNGAREVVYCSGERLGTEPRSPCITELHPSPQQQPPLS